MLIKHNFCYNFFILILSLFYDELDLEAEDIGSITADPRSEIEILMVSIRYYVIVSFII